MQSLLYSGLLLATFLGTMAVTTPSANTSVPNEEARSSDSRVNQTSGTYVTSSNAIVGSNEIKQPTTASLNTPRSTAPTTSVTDSSSDSKSCDCLFDLENRDNHILLLLGGLTLGCVILLITTIALALQVCHLKRHFRDYEPYRIETSTANGKRRADEGREPDETTIMMSKMSPDNETTREAAENSKETKEEREVNTGTDAVESDKPAASGTSDGDKSAASEAKQPESSAEEATAGAKDVTNGTESETKKETVETTKTNAEVATAPEGSGSEA